MMATSDLSAPSFLVRTEPVAAPRRRRWKRMRAKRPEGQMWEHAERWEVTLGPEHSYTKANGRAGGLAAGTRRVWAVEGRKWVYLRDAEDYVKLSLAEWRQLQRSGREVQP